MDSDVPGLLYSPEDHMIRWRSSETRNASKNMSRKLGDEIHLRPEKSAHYGSNVVICIYRCCLEDVGLNIHRNRY
jgi:hypothetical protein